MNDPKGSRPELADLPPPEAAVYVISVAAQLTGLHPQTLRTYERMGLVAPSRTGGGGRRYSARDIEQLRSVAQLSAAGIGLEGVRRILELQNQVAALQQRNAELGAELAAVSQALQQTLSATRAGPPQRRNTLPVLPDSPGSQSVVVWRRSP